MLLHRTFAPGPRPDTIKVMKSNVDGMEGDMDQFKGIMGARKAEG
jgi:hypothetical protein